MPYANGRWVWNPYYGYTWDSYDNCGWFTHHYGRWQWDYSSGWYWLPGYHWSPAWVSWFGDNNYYGWCPLSWWNRPVVVINNRWDRNYDYRRGIPFHSRSTIIIRKNELSAANAQRVALNRNTLGRNGTESISYRGTAPGERPALSKVTVFNAEGRAMSYKQGGIVSSEKYRATNSANGRATEYKYNPVSKGTYSDSAYRKKNSERLDQTNGGNSRYGSEGSATSRSRYTSSGSSEKATAKAGYGSRAKNSGSERATSSSSSSTSSSTEKAKKKKDAPAYMTGTGYGQGGTEKASAASTERVPEQIFRQAAAPPTAPPIGPMDRNTNRRRAPTPIRPEANALPTGPMSRHSKRRAMPAPIRREPAATGQSRVMQPASLPAAIPAAACVPTPPPASPSPIPPTARTAPWPMNPCAGAPIAAAVPAPRPAVKAAAALPFAPIPRRQAASPSAPTSSSYSAPSSTHTSTAVHKKDKR